VATKFIRLGLAWLEVEAVDNNGNARTALSPNLETDRGVVGTTTADEIESIKVEFNSSRTDESTADSFQPCSFNLLFSP
jgi:hypothetical protein